MVAFDELAVRCLKDEAEGSRCNQCGRTGCSSEELRRKPLERPWGETIVYVFLTEGQILVEGVEAGASDAG